jgi:hypothetical protein
MVVPGRMRGSSIVFLNGGDRPRNKEMRDGDAGASAEGDAGRKSNTGDLSLMPA